MFFTVIIFKRLYASNKISSFFDQNYQTVLRWTTSFLLFLLKGTRKLYAFLVSPTEDENGLQMDLVRLPYPFLPFRSVCFLFWNFQTELCLPLSTLLVSRCKVYANMTRLEWAYPSGAEDDSNPWISGATMILAVVTMNIVRQKLGSSLSTTIPHSFALSTILRTHPPV